ncbi:transposase IS204/IS1001/IS1096/IS1165 family protein [Candidatus Protofrankia datiscae]|uniref:Transposase IS204/IS1001/IS1096/IS1165 family protein n=1 Tax=Candidatus Protofrankia datiscae TaxID=2716812 RepID=F8B0Y8_9ACTN|nr:transposase IS204/IS1001/IS1096/IS1165 family protein [Candidatus Protofrankia datiscae]AEH10197.1 transposase IS204/IS1001/IS1096/IS1165 family protein [Candidatus Protofrankia datiscae]
MRVFKGRGCALGGLLGLPASVEVELVEREADGSFTVHVRTAAGVEACCPGCGVPAGRVREAAGQTVAHLAVVPMAVTWHKHRFWCDNGGCDQAVFTEGGPLAARGGTVSAAAKETMGHLVGDWVVAVDLVARTAGVSWHIAHRGFVAVAEEAGIVVTAPAGRTGADEPVGDEENAVGGEAGVDGEAGRGPGGGRPARSVSGPLPAVEVLGIDDHRRGRPRYHRDPISGGWVADADRWQTGLFDSRGGHGLLGAVEGRTAAATAGWIGAQPAAWRAGIQAVTIDMSGVYKSAARDALPHAMIAVDPFHVAQLANKAVGDVRRRVTHQLRGRRGRATDPEYTIRTLLVRGPGTLSDNGRAKILTTLADLGGEESFAIGAAWRAKNHLLGLLALSPTRTGRATTRTDVDRALTRFFEYCATTGATVPEIVTLAETVSDWRVGITGAILHGLSNAAAEGVNRLIKLVYRTAFGLTNVPNQQRRARYVASRSTRPAWLHPVTTHAAAA